MTVNAPAVTTPHPYRWVLMGGLVACSWGVLWYGFTIGVLLPDIRADLDLSSSQQGWLSSSFFLGQMLFALPATAVIARYSPLRAMFAFYLFAAALTALAALVPAYLPQLLLRFGVSLVFVSITPIRTMVLAGWFDRAEITKANGIFNSGFGAVQTVGLWASGALLGFIGGWRAMMVLFFALAAAGAASWALIARAAPAPMVTPHVADPSLRGRSWLEVLRNPEVIALCLIGVGGAMTWSAFLTFWPGVARDTLGLSESRSGFIMGCTAVAVIPGSLFAAPAVRILGGRLPFLLVTTLAQVPTFSVFVLTGNISLLIVVGLLQGLTWIYFPILLSVPFDIHGFDQRDVAIATALFIVLNGAGLSAGPSIAGVLGSVLPMRTVLLGFALAPLISTVGALALGRERIPVT